MKAARFIGSIKPKIFLLIMAWICIVYISIPTFLRNFGSYFSTVENLNALNLQCDDDFTVDESEQKNENDMELEDCKGSKKVFGHSLKENKQIVNKYTFKLSNDFMKRLQLDRDGISKLSHQKPKNETYLPTFVTALSNNHFEESVGLFNSLNILKNQSFPELTVIVYDIGLTREKASMVQGMCNCSVRTFPFEAYPRHVRNLRGYTWKPIIIQMMLQEFDFVSWLDTSIRLKDAIPYFKRARRHGIMVLYGYGSIAVRTQQRLFKHFNEDQCMFNYPETQTGVVIVSRSCTTLKYIMRPWVACALEYGCMDFPNSNKYLKCNGDWKLSSCHRFEQSTIGMILTRLFHSKRHQFKIGADFADVCRECVEPFKYF